MFKKSQEKSKHFPIKTLQESKTPEGGAICPPGGGGGRPEPAAVPSRAKHTLACLFLNPLPGRKHNPCILRYYYISRERSLPPGEGEEEEKEEKKEEDCGGTREPGKLLLST